MKYLLLFVFLSFGEMGMAQQISVLSFKKLENDLSARGNDGRVDQNGDKCAIIKVVTNETGFVFEPDALGIVGAVQKTGEIWLYVPYGARHLTIKHPHMRMLRNYVYPEWIGKACVYELVVDKVRESNEKLSGQSNNKVVDVGEGRRVQKRYTTTITYKTSEKILGNSCDCGEVLVDSRDGQSYRIRQLADGRCWMIENLRFGKCDVKAWKKYFKKESRNQIAKGYYGVCIRSPQLGGANLYNWQAAMNVKNIVSRAAGNSLGNIKRVSITQWQGICPQGWHLPDRDEFENLYLAYTKDSSKIYPGTDAFRGVLGGCNYGDFVKKGGIYWSSTYADDASAYNLQFRSNFVHPQNYFDKSCGAAVRCVKDY